MYRSFQEKGHALHLVNPTSPCWVRLAANNPEEADKRWTVNLSSNKFVLKIAAQEGDSELQEGAGSSKGGSESTRVHSTIRKEEGKGGGVTSNEQCREES